MRNCINTLVVLLVLCATSLSAQEKSTNEAEPDQPKTSDVVQKLVGKWKGDAEKTSELHGDDASEEMLDQIASVTFVFNKDGGMQMKSDSFEVNAQFSATKSEDEENVYDFEFSGGDAPNAMTGTLKFADDHTIHLSPGGRPAGVFVRQAKTDDKPQADDKPKTDSKDMPDEKAMSVEEAKLKLMGTWKGDAEATRESAKKLELDESMLEMISKSVSQLTLTFKDDDSYTMNNADMGEQEGTWKFTKGEATGSFTLIAETPEGELEFAVKFNGDDQVSLQTSPEEAAAVFKRSSE